MDNQNHTSPLSYKSVGKMEICVHGMHCRSCEITLERNWKKIPGIQKVQVNASSGKGTIYFEGEAPTIEQLQRSIPQNEYSVHLKGTENSVEFKKEKPSFFRLLGLFAVVLILGKLLTSFGLLKTNFNVSQATGFGAIFVIGLVAASSSCVAIVGGLLISTSVRFNERYSSTHALGRMRPVMLFVLGRILSYTVLGGLLGVIGGVLSPSPIITALITLLAALYMLIMGLEMLHLAPNWLKRLLPGTNKALSHKIMNAEAKEHWAMPFLLGGATFFLPCGFTQALQLYALTTGNFWIGAVTMLAFALGTAPALLALGYASNSLKGKFGKLFFQFSGALVVILGLWNMQNAFAIAGYPLSFSVGKNQSETTGSSVTTGNVQVVKMKVDALQGYLPSNIIIEAGKPVRWEIDGTKATGCANVIVSRKLGIQKVLQKGINVIEFPAQEPGTIAFSCSMGMYRGSFTVVTAKN